MATIKKLRSTEGLTTLDEFLGEQGSREAFQAKARSGRIRILPFRARASWGPDKPDIFVREFGLNSGS